MTGPADLPEGFVLDPAPGPLPQGDAMDTAGGPTVAEIMAAADNPMPLTPHEVYCEHLRSAIAGSRPTGRSVLELSDTRGAVEAWIGSRTGRQLGTAATWIRIIRPDLDRGALFLIDCLHPCREAELTVVADPGVISRSTIRDVCRWAFYGLHLWRLVVRVPANRPDLSKLAGKARFRFEGTARGFYGGVIDAHVWAMNGMECPWLPSMQSAASPPDIPAPVNKKAC